jgi:hypothetical protein
VTKIKFFLIYIYEIFIHLFSAQSLERTSWAVLNKPKPKVEPPKPEAAAPKTQPQQAQSNGAEPHPPTANGTKPNEGGMEVD